MFFLILNYLIKSCENISNLSSNIRPYTNIIGDFLIKYCYFQRFNTYVGDGTTQHWISTGNSGGVFYFYNVLSNFSLFEITFNDCRCIDNGGAIFYTSNIIGSNINFNKICGYLCYCY